MKAAETDQAFANIGLTPPPDLPAPAGSLFHLQVDVLSAAYSAAAIADPRVAQAIISELDSYRFMHSENGKARVNAARAAAIETSGRRALAYNSDTARMALARARALAKRL